MESLPQRFDNVERKRVVKSEIYETRTFSREEILHVINIVAQVEGYDKDDLILISEYIDSSDSIVCSTVMVRVTVAHEQRCGEILFEYMLAGSYGKVGFNEDTCGVTSSGWRKEGTPGNNPKGPYKPRWAFSGI